MDSWTLLCFSEAQSITVRCCCDVTLNDFSTDQLLLFAFCLLRFKKLTFHFSPTGVVFPSSAKVSFQQLASSLYA
jgi:hypothetical protein